MPQWSNRGTIGEGLGIIADRSKLSDFHFGLVPCQLGQKGTEFQKQWTCSTYCYPQSCGLLCSTLTFHRKIRRLAFLLYPREPECPHKLTLIQSPGNGCLPASQRVSEDMLWVCVCVCVCVWLEEVPSTTGVVTGPKFTQKCVAWGREVLWPPLTARLEFQPPPSPSPLSPGCSATYISQRDMHDDPHLLVRWQKLDGGEERADDGAGEKSVQDRMTRRWSGWKNMFPSEVKKNQPWLEKMEVPISDGEITLLVWKTALTASRFKKIKICANTAWCAKRLEMEKYDHHIKCASLRNPNCII